PSGALPRTAPSCLTCSLTLLLPAAPAADDELVGFLVLAAGALAERRHAPGRDRVTTALRLALAAAVRVVDRVHRRPADGRALAEPARTAGLAAADVAVVDVAHLAHGGATRQQHAPHLPGREAERRVALALGHKLAAGARRPRHLPALARLQLDVVHERAGGDALERQRVPGLDVGARAGLQLGADPEACRSEDVRLEAVRVVEQRDPGRPVRVVLDRGHPRRDAVLRP